MNENEHSDNGQDVPVPDINQSGMTISQFMSQHGKARPLELEAGGKPTPVPIETDPDARKYEVGSVVAKGGMGAILNARDLNCRRTVASF